MGLVSQYLAVIIHYWKGGFAKKFESSLSPEHIKLWDIFSMDADNEQRHWEEYLADSNPCSLFPLSLLYQAKSCLNETMWRWQNNDVCTLHWRKKVDMLFSHSRYISSRLPFFLSVPTVPSYSTTILHENCPPPKNSQNNTCAIYNCMRTTWKCSRKS